MAPVYQVTDLLKVRDKAKDSAEVLRKINSEPAVRDHVLRSSASSLGHNSVRSRARSSSIVTNPWDDYERPPTDEPILRNKSRNKSNRGSKYSPTPSIKRGKAEKLLKEHGSPPGVRVTAGGRIVPDGLSGITIPRFDPADLTRYQNPTISRTNPGSIGGHPMLRQLNGMLVDIGNGALCQIVDGELKPVHAHNGHLNLYMPIMNKIVQPSLEPNTPMGTAMYQAPLSFPGNFATGVPTVYNNPNNSQGDSIGTVPSEREVKIMQDFQKDLENELKVLDRDEVLHKNELTATAKAEITKKRVELTLRIDQCRKGIIAARKKRDSAGPTENQAHPVAPVQPIFAAQPWPMQLMDPYGSGVQQQFLPFHAMHLAQNAFDMPNSSPSATEYQHGAGLVVPLPYHQHYVENAVPHPQGMQNFVPYSGVQQAPTNSNAVSANPPPAVGTEQVAQAVKSMNLDGSTQGRRSRAIEIKNPNDQLAKSKSALDPTSPTYQPSGMPSKSPVSEYNPDGSSFVPSPRLVAKIDNLVKSPAQGLRELVDASDENAPPQGSSSSATTGDFFPNDTHRYSSNKYSYPRRDSGVNIPGWIGGESGPAFGNVTTPTKAIDKPPWSESPMDGAFHTAPNTDERSSITAGRNHRSFNGRDPYPSADEDFDMAFIDQTAFQHISPAMQKHQSAALRSSGSGETYRSPSDNKSPSARLIREAIERAATFQDQSSPTKTPVKTDSYLEGYHLGMKLDIISSARDADFNRGYRDGIMYASSRACKSNINDRSQRGLGGLQVDTALANYNAGLPSLSRASSLPIFNMPGGPAKLFENAGLSARDASPLAPPPASAEMRIMSTGAIPYKQIGTQTSDLQMRSPDPPSPLANRYSGNQMPSPSVGKGQSYSPRVPSMHAFDQQRYAKASTSVAPSNNHARGKFQQLDGSADDDVPSESIPISKNPASPATKDKNYSSPKPSGSPVKQRASAALARIEQLAGVNRKSKSTAEQSSDEGKSALVEKEKRRVKWAKRFENVKQAEQKEIEEYNSKNPKPSPRK